MLSTSIQTLDPSHFATNYPCPTSNLTFRLANDRVHPFPGVSSSLGLDAQVVIARSRMASTILVESKGGHGGKPQKRPRSTSDRSSVRLSIPFIIATFSCSSDLWCCDDTHILDRTSACSSLSFSDHCLHPAYHLACLCLTTMSSPFCCLHMPEGYSNGVLCLPSAIQGGARSGFSISSMKYCVPHCHDPPKGFEFWWR